jgi:flagellar assembly factor FliW
MKILSRPLGEIEIDERQIIKFPKGLLGFGEYKKFALLDSPQKPFLWLQSLDESEIAFVLIDPEVFRRDFSLSPAGDELEQLNLESEKDLISFAIVTIPSDSNKMTANLQGTLGN